MATKVKLVFLQSLITCISIEVEENRRRGTGSKAGGESFSKRHYKTKLVLYLSDNSELKYMGHSYTNRRTNECGRVQGKDILTMDSSRARHHVLIDHELNFSWKSREESKRLRSNWLA